MYPRRDIIPTRPLNIRPCNILNRKSRAVTPIPGVNTRRDVNGLIDVAELEIAESDVADAALAGVGLDPRGVGRVVAFEVLEEDIVDVVGAVAVAEGSDDGAPGFVAGYVADVDVFAVAFDGDAVLYRTA